MKLFKLSIAFVMGLALLIGLFISQASAQTNNAPVNRQQQQMAREQHLLDMNDQLGRMTALQNRVHAIHQLIQDRIQGVGSPTGQDNGSYLRHLQDLETEIGNVGDHLKATIERYNELRDDESRMRNAYANKDMKALKEHLTAFTDKMNLAVSTLEDMTNRIVAIKEKK